MPGVAVPGQWLSGPSAATGCAPARLAPGDLAHPMAPQAAGPTRDRESSDDGSCWEDSDWDPAGSLTAREIAALAALDRAGDPAVNWDDTNCGAVPMAPDCWPGGRSQHGDHYSLLDDGPVEALPGLMPRHLGTGGGFDAGGVADRVPPGPVLAGLAGRKWASGLSRASDDELAGLMIAWRRVASWAAAGEMAAVAELRRRREAQVTAGADAHLAEHVSDEVAMALMLTSWAAGRLVDRAQGLARLPRTRAALAAGQIDVPKALVILGELSGLDGVHAARVEAAVIGRAAGWTTGELRQAARRQVIAADPAAARRRKERAREQARVERWAEDAGTAALAGRDLPPAAVLAADTHLTAWAKRLKAAGLAGNLDQLRAQVYLALLNGESPGTLLNSQSPGAPLSADPSKAAAEAEHSSAKNVAASAPSATEACGVQGTTAPSAAARQRSAPASGRPPAQASHQPPAPASHLPPSPASRQPPAPASHLPPVPASRQPPASSPDRASGPVRESSRGSVNLVLPLSTWLGWSSSPGEIAGFGPLDAADSRALAAALARDPATKWCVTVTGADSRAVAHGCAKAAPGQPPAEPADRCAGPGPGTGSGPGAGPSPREGQGPREDAGPREGPGPPPLPPRLRAWLADVSLAWLETGECGHRRESPGYRPSRELAHLIQVRQVTCTAPGCRRPAASCDFEHTVPYHEGGRSCECNGGPCCRRHHRAKQASGWQLSQPRPGVFVWSTPHGRSYQTGPEPYPG